MHSYIILLIEHAQLYHIANRTCTVISYCSKQNRHKLNTNLCYGINIYFFLICSLLDVLEVVAPFKQFQKLRDFMTSKLPEGFPVQIG